MALEDSGFIVTAFNNPLLALSYFTANAYDLLLLDIRMPEMNGFALYREFKRLVKKVKACFLTAGEMYYGVYSDIFSSLPANCFVRKPIDNKGLVELITQIMGVLPYEDFTH